MRAGRRLGALVGSVFLAAVWAFAQAPATEETLLEPARSVEGDLAAGARAYQVRIGTGQHLRVTVVERGVPVILTVSGPGLTSVELRGARERGPQLSLVGEEGAEALRLEVRPRDTPATSGRYEIVTSELREATPQDRSRSRADVAMARGKLQLRQGTVPAWRDSVRLLEEARIQYHEAADPAGEALALHLMGAGYLYLRQPSKALEFALQSMEMRRALSDERGQADALANAAIAYVHLGDFQKGLDSYQQALAQSRAIGDREEEARTLHNLGLLYKTLGDFEQALGIYKEALVLRRATGGGKPEAMTLNNIGEVLVGLDRPQEGREHYEKALAIFRGLGDRSAAVKPLHGLGLVQRAQGDSEGARTRFQEALDLAREVEDRDVQAASLTDLGRIAEEGGDAGGARASFLQALELFRAVEDRAGEAEMLALIARVEAALGEPGAARTRVETALEIVESLRSRVPGADLRTSFFAARHHASSTAIEVLLRLHAREPDRGHDVRAFEVSERARARALIDLLVEARADIREGVEGDLVARERTLLEQMSVTERRQMEILGGKGSPPAATAIKDELAQLLAQYQQVQAEIRSRSPRYAALTQPAALSLREVQGEILDKGSVLLEYALGERASVLWAVGPTSFRTYRLPPRSEIEAAARRFHALLTSPSRRRVRGETERAAALLSRVLLAPARDDIAGKRLVVVGDGILQFIPFAALPDPGAKDAPIVAGHETVMLPSASVVAVLRRELAGRPPAPKLAAVISDPVFTAGDPRVRGSRDGAAPPSVRANSDLTRAGTESGLPELKRLLYSRREAQTIAALVPREQLLLALDFAANRTTARSPELSEYRIVHFATHGLLNSRHPELSGIVLSLVDEAGQPQNGFLRAHEVYNLRLGADLVVLSACRTALGRDVRGEGLIGLTRGFMYAGSPRVLASLWDVQDEATAELMKHFYRGLLHDGLRPAAALRRAQVRLWREQPRRGMQDWAGFVLQGEWR